MKDYIGNEELIPMNERAFLQWKDVSYFVPLSKAEKKGALKN